MSEASEDSNERSARCTQTVSEASTFTHFWQWLRGTLGLRNGESHLRNTIEEIIEEIEEHEGGEEAGALIGSHERVMLANILKLRHLTAYDVMVPRADIIAVEINSGIDELIDVMGRGGHSRLPVYRNT
ncbi:MAG: magnesium/cobalt efflux protein, partial [Kiloniellales bacterium]